MDKLFEYSKCPICGKKFFPAPQHMYRMRDKYGRKTQYVCTWTCYCEAERRHSALHPKKLRGDKPTVRELQTIERKLNREVKSK